jgi:hypothetical protein|tara:strand:+ start:1308 stop:1601 length:294 start_codon:yes stop_codon:yes gene_type:complete
MANNQYVVAENWGTGFIEHNESREISFTGHPGNVWQVPAKNGTANKWISKVLGQLKTKNEAQAIVDAEITARQTEWDTLSDSEKELTDRPVNITLED